jgi:hypothetical protein
MSNDDRPLDPETAKIVAKVRRLMMIASATTFIAVAVVLIVIGYRLFNAGGSAPTGKPAAFADVTATLPAGAKVVSTAVGADHIVVTVEVGGVTELRTFDPDTLAPLGRLRLEPKP